MQYFVNPLNNMCTEKIEQESKMSAPLVSLLLFFYSECFGVQGTYDSFLGIDLLSFEELKKYLENETVHSRKPTSSVKKAD